MDNPQFETPSNEDFARYQEISNAMHDAALKLMKRADDPIRAMEILASSYIDIYSVLTGADSMTLLEASTINIRGYILQRKEVAENEKA